MKYKVTRQHWGDKQYYEGDEREVKVKGDAEQLITMGLIAESDDAGEADAKAQAEQAKAEAAKVKAEKAAAKAENKMAEEPANKTE